MSGAFAKNISVGLNELLMTVTRKMWLSHIIVLCEM